ncbi:MAG: DNA translocase FtsK [Candidatus Omnitrophica bacterium]|nr:DNA translocase FtsK [Candidatus Omnitrophota bacterium]
MRKKSANKKLNEIIGLSFFLIGLFTLASLVFHHPEDHPFFNTDPNRSVQNPTGLIGVYVSHYFLLAFGYSAYFISVMAIFWALCHFVQRVPEKKLLKWMGFLFLLIAASGLFALAAEQGAKAIQGGFVGYVLDVYLERYFGPLGAFIILTAFMLLSLLLATDFFLFPMVEAIFSGVWGLVRKVGEWFAAAGEAVASLGNLFRRRTSEASKARKPLLFKKEKEKEKEKDKEVAREIEKSFFDKEIAVKVKKYEPTVIPAKKNNGFEKSEAAVEKPAREKEKERPKPAPAASTAPAAALNPVTSSKASNYALPPLDFLNVPQQSRKNADDDLKVKSRLLESTLKDFDIEARVIEIEQGPTVTRYELMPAPGVKVSSIVSLSDDLALALKAASIRIIAPIPGKAAVGIEVPNSVADTVYLRELLEASKDRIQSCRLPLTLGKDTSGKPLIADLTEMPHLLIAGTTGSGKTVCVNSIIAGLLYSRRPDELKFVMIDPKMVELAIYNALPHMLAPVVTDIKKAAATLNWVVGEMENRYKLFAKCTVRNIQGFNQRERKDEDPEIPQRLPYIMVIIDELADLMMVAQDKVETAITRLAQLSRAVGIHLVLATQRPSVDVITGVIKANFPARISFKVASKVDSRTVLDLNGADKLLGRGDMLFLEPGSAKPTRGQAALVTDKEITSVVEFSTQQGAVTYQLNMDQVGQSEAQGEMGEKDELYEQAVKVIVETRQASTSILQRRLRLGYGRAARMLDMMEAEGIVGPPQGTKPREVLVEKLSDIV